MAGRLRQGLSRQASPDVMAAYVSHFWQAHLPHHFRQEETLLLPLLDAPATADLAEHMVREHRLIQHLVIRVEADTGERVQELAELSRMLKAHIRFEERELFPTLEGQASEEALREVGVWLQEGHAEAGLSWTPAFWE